MGSTHLVRDEVRVRSLVEVLSNSSIVLSSQLLRSSLSLHSKIQSGAMYGIPAYIRFTVMGTGSSQWSNIYVQETKLQPMQLPSLGHFVAELRDGVRWGMQCWSGLRFETLES
jgi:hypothetical protein